MAKKITVIGATGMIGVPVTRELLKAGFEITALVRNIEKAAQIFPQGVKFVKGDLDDPKSIATALEGAEGLYINISTRAEDKVDQFNPEMNGLDNILAVAKTQPTLKQVAYLSSFLARNYQGNWWVFQAKKSSISRVKQSGLPYIIFYPSNFMENFANGMVQNGKIMIPTIAMSNKAWWIAGEDFGKQVAKTFQQPHLTQKEYAIQGLEAMTMQEAATIYIQSFHKQKLSISSMPLSIMKFLAIFISQLKFVSKLMDVMLRNVEIFEAHTTWDELGKPEITIADFAQKQSV